MIVKAVMVPHPPIALAEVGRGEEVKISATLNAFKTAMKEIADSHPDTVIVLSPHAVMYRDWFNVSSGKKASGSMARFHAGSVKFEKEYDTELTALLDRMFEQDGFSAGMEYDRDKSLDHGTMVPLYFLDQFTKDYKLVRIGLSGLSLPMHYRLGQYIKAASDQLGRRIAVIGSGDLAHCQKEDGPYGFKPEGPAYDERIMKDMGNADFKALFSYSPAFLDACMECGHRSFVIMAGILDGIRVTPHVLSHEATFGVGYGIITYDIGGEDESRHFLEQYETEEKKQMEAMAEASDPYVRLARQSVSYYVKTGLVLKVPDGLPEEMLGERAGCFVSIHKYSSLRGCIGTISPTKKNIAEEIIANGISACSRDPRFNAVTEEELPFLEINVDVLGKPEKIKDRSELDVKRYGVICTSGYKRGLLLPDLEGVDTVDQQIAIACSKGNIDPDDENLEMERFEVIRHV
ncbi:MAG: AmmeMemoRadiSam system protein A [Erysipelotrichaceae bacterium]|nr:AmmeMemoRadiSam system protein A [Erysipelotrichaceae bacterium]